MNAFHQAARDVLTRHPAPAMTLAEFLEAIERDYPEHRADGPAVVRSLQRADGIRVLHRPASAKEAELGPAAWVLSYRKNRSKPVDPCLATRRLRESVVTLGKSFRTNSLSGWARWNHLAMGAALVCSGQSHHPSARRPTERRWADPRSPAISGA